MWFSRRKKLKKKTLSGAGPSVDPVCLSPARSYKVLFVFYWPTHWDSVLSLCYKPDAAVAEDKPEVNGNQQDNGAVQGIHTHTSACSFRHSHADTHTRKQHDAKCHTLTDTHMAGTCVCWGPFEISGDVKQAQWPPFDVHLNRHACDDDCKYFTELMFKCVTAACQYAGL